MRKKIILLSAILIFFALETRAEKFYQNIFDGKPFIHSKHYFAAKKMINEKVLLDHFDDFMNREGHPSTDKFVNFMQEVIGDYCQGNNKYDKCHRRYYYYVLNILRFNNQIDNLFYLIIDDRLRNKKANLKDLSHYLRSLNVFYKKRQPLDHHFNQNDISFLYTRIMAQKIGLYKGLTPRQALYLKYNTFQIKYLAYQLKKTMNIMNSETAYIFVDMANDPNMSDIRLDLSYPEKYRLGVKLLAMQLNDLQLDPRFGFKPQLIDILIAGIEVGIISPVILNDLYMMPEFVDSYRNRYRVYRDILKQVGRTVLLNIPYVGQISLLPIMIIEIRQDIRNNRRSASNETHLF